jgi:uncharacterized protein YdcH (DUF465 family)
METTQEKQVYEIKSLGIQYNMEQDGELKVIKLTEHDFEKIFDKIRELQNQIGDLQNQVIEELKKQALIKNILNG